MKGSGWWDAEPPAALYTATRMGWVPTRSGRLFQQQPSMGGAVKPKPVRSGGDGHLQAAAIS